MTVTASKAPFAMRRLATSALVLVLMTAPVFVTPTSWAATHDPQDAIPELMLANAWKPALPLSEYWVSEKFDGVRGYWDGHALWTRRGGRVVCPDWFTAGWPSTPMDGEMWAGRGAFETAQSTVAVNAPNDAAWRKMAFMVFDLPSSREPFDLRKDTLAQLVDGVKIPWLRVVDQRKVASGAELQRDMMRTVADGGEGLMLHRGSSLYRGVRSDDLVKLKPHDDADARVVAYVPGKGKYADVMGALIVQLPSGARFKLGSGFSDADRASPPAIGSVVTYRYRGLNKTGIPRFATFLRVNLV
jgi:DNA ligase-1